MSLCGGNIWLIITNCTSSKCPYYFSQEPPCSTATQGAPLQVYTYGEICPAGYSSACTSVTSLGTDTVTVQMCCPYRFVFLLPPTMKNSMFTLLSILPASNASPNYLLIIGHRLWIAPPRSRQQKLFLPPCLDSELTLPKLPRSWQLLQML